MSLRPSQTLCMSKVIFSNSSYMSSPPLPSLALWVWSRVFQRYLTHEDILALVEEVQLLLYSCIFRVSQIFYIDCVCTHVRTHAWVWVTYAIVCVWPEDNLSVGPCLLPTLRPGLWLFVGNAACARRSGFRVSMDSQVPTIHLAVGALGLQRYTTMPTFYEFWGFELWSLCIASTLSTEPSHRLCF